MRRAASGLRLPPSFRLAWRSLLARPLRSVLTALGVGLGVAVLFAALAAGEAMDRTIDRAAAADIGRATIRVSAVAERGLSPATLGAVEGTPGVQASAAAFTRRTYLAATDATSATQLPPAVTVFGIDPAAEPKLHDLPLAAGTALTAGLERSALVTETLAAQEHLGLGDEVTVNGAAGPGPQAYRIVGVLRGDGPLADAQGRVVVLPLAAAQALFDSTGVTRIDIEAAPGVSETQLAARLEARLTTDPYMLSTESDVAASLRASTGGIRSVLLLVAALVLFVGAFLIFNTLSMTVAERARDVALLRAAGTTRRQVMDLVLLQGAVLGAFGAVLGIAAGAVVAVIATAWLRDAGSPIVEEPVSGWSAATAAAIGILVTLAAALEPAWRASRMPPAEALRRRSEARAGTVARLRWLAVVFCALGAAAFVLSPAVGGPAGPSIVGSSVNAPEPLGAVSSSLGPLLGFGLLLLSVLALPMLQRPLLAVAGVPLRIFRTQERLARSSLARDPSRTALTAGALVVGVAMVVALGAASQNVRQVGSTWLNETVPGSELLTSIRPLGLGEAPVAQIARVPGVASVTPIALFGAPLNGVRQDSAAVQGAALLADGRLTFTALAPGATRDTALSSLDDGGTVILPESVAQSLGAGPGDSLSFGTGPAPTVLRVAGVVAHSIPGANGETILVGWKDAQSAFGVAGADFLAIRYANEGSAEASAARQVVDGIAFSHALEPSDLARIGSTLGGTLDQVFRLLDALAIAAVVVAGLGVVNTLSMSVLERVREIGVLRAAGMTGRQVWGMVVVEAAVLGIAGAVLGCLTGLIVGLLFAATSSAGFGLTFDVPWLAIAFGAGFGVLVTIAASIYPARLASRISIVRALQYE